MDADGDSPENEDDIEGAHSFLMIVLFTCHDLTIETLNFVTIFC